MSDTPNIGKRRAPRSRYRRKDFKPGGLPMMTATNPLCSPDAIRIMGYDSSCCEEATLTNVNDINKWQAKWPKLWIDVDGLGNSDLLLKLGNFFSIHALTMEDIFDARHQPKIEEYENYIFLLIKHGSCEQSLDLEQISILLFKHVVITIRERPGESFKAVHERIRQGQGKIREYGSDFLACALIDATVEGYYPILSTLRHWLDDIEDSFIEKSGPDMIRRIHDVKRDLLLLHSAVWPVQELMYNLTKHTGTLIQKETYHYIRDCLDQAKQVKELAEFYRLLASDLMNTTLAFSDNKANEVMKVLTMVTAVFIPLSFIASLYGMNFDTASPYNMPELKSRYGYPIVLAVMGGVAVVILWLFKRKGWFSKR